MAILLLMQNVSALLLGLLLRWKNMLLVSVSNTSALSLWMGNIVSHRSSRYHSGNWVTSHTICYINITGGHSYKKEGLHSEPCWLLSTMHNTFSAGNTKEIHPCKKPRQKKKQQTEMCYEPSKQDAVEKAKRRTKWWSGIEVENSYQAALNPKRGEN